MQSSFLLLLTSLSALLSPATATCSNFTAHRISHGDTSYTIPNPGTLVVSAAINCSNAETINIGIEGPIGELTYSCDATQCPLYTPEDYQVRVNRTLNITTSSRGVADGIFELVNGLGYFQTTQDKMNLNRSWVYGISQVSTCLDQGQAGYWGFTPTLRCVDGTLSGCDTGSGDPADGTALTACGVTTLQDGEADGTLSVVQYAGLNLNMPPPPNATLTKGDKNQENEADAVTLSGVGIVVSLAAVGFAMVL